MRAFLFQHSALRLAFFFLELQFLLSWCLRVLFCLYSYVCLSRTHLNVLYFKGNTRAQKQKKKLTSPNPR